MATDLESLKRKRDQLNARIQKTEAREKANLKKADDRVKVLVGAAFLDQLKNTGSIKGGGMRDLLSLLDGFLSRTAEREAVLGADLQGSEALHRVVGLVRPTSENTDLPQ